jgi:hypothetical protein
MPILSRMYGKIPGSILANVFLLSKFDLSRGSEITFEVLEEDAGGLRTHLKQRADFALDGQRFVATLKSLEACGSSHPGLSQQKHRRTLRGVFLVIGDPPACKK